MVAAHMRLNLWDKCSVNGGWQKDAIFWIGCHLKPFITILQKSLKSVALKLLARFLPQIYSP